MGEHIEALRRDPSSKALAQAVRQAARQSGEFARYAGAFAERGRTLAASERTPEAIDSLVEAALVYEEELEDLEAAAALYEFVLELKSDHRRALFALGLLLHDLGRWDELIALYRRRLHASRDDGERTTLHLYVAELLSERLGDDRAAFREVMTAARLTPRNLRIIGRLEALGASTGQAAEVAVTIGDLLLHQDDPRVRAALSLRLAELHLGPLGDEKRALAHLRGALADDGGNPEILQEIEDVFRERARFDALADLLEEVARDRRVGPHRVRLERELARIYELELDDAARALAALTRALKHAPDDRELLDEVMRLGLISGDLALVAETYELVSASTENTLLQTYMRLKLGHIYANVLDRFDDALRIYGMIIEQEPDHKEARRRLVRIHQRREDWQEVARLLEEEVRLREGTGELLQPLVELARVRGQRLGAERAAAQVWKRVLELDSSHAEALAALAALRLPAPEADLAAQVGSSSLEARADEQPTEFDGEPFGPESETQYAPSSLLAGARAPAASSRLFVDAAASDSRPITSRGPPPPPPPDDEDGADLLAAALEAEAELLAQDGAAGSGAPGAPHLARRPEEPTSEIDLDVISEVIQGIERPPQVSDSLEAELSALAPEEEALEWLDAQAEAIAAAAMAPVTAVRKPPPLPEEVDEDSEATQALLEGERELLTSEIEDLGAAGGLTELLLEGERDLLSSEGRSGPHPDAPAEAPADPAGEQLEALEDELAAAERRGDEERILELLSALVGATAAAGDDPGALAAQARLVERAPTRANLEALLQLGARADNLRLAVRAVDGIAGQLDLRERVALGLALARHEAIDLADPDAAAARLAALRAETPDPEAVLEAEHELLVAAGRGEEAFAHLASRALASGDREVARSLAERAAACAREVLGDPRRATALWIELAARAPEDEALFRPAAEALAAEERHAELAALYEVLIEHREGDERAAARVALAELQLEILGDPGAAEANLRAGLEERASDSTLLGLLGRTLAEAGRWSERLEVGRRQLELQEAPLARAALARDLAGVAEQVGDGELASVLWSEAVRADPGEPETLAAWIESLRRREDRRGLAEALALLASTAPEPQAAVEALVELAGLRLAQAGPEAAREALEEALALVPEHPAALLLLSRVHQEAGDDLAALQVLQRSAEATTGPERAASHLRAAQILRERLHDEEGAAAELEAALEHDPKSLEALRASMELAEAAGDFFSARGLAVRAAERATGPEQAALWRRAGELAEQRLGDQLGAIEHYQRALNAAPEETEARAALGELLFARQEHRRAHPHLLRAAQELGEGERALDLLRSAALAALHAHDGAAAAAAFEEVLARAPDDAVALERLGALLASRSPVPLPGATPTLDAPSRAEWQRVHDLGAHQILHHEGALGAGERAAVYLRMARAQHALGELEAAVRLARRGLQLADGSREALQILAAVLEASGEPFEAAECLRRLAPLETDPAERRQLLLGAARLLGEGAGDLARAAATLGEAQAHAPGDLEVAERLAGYRERLGDGLGAADALVVPARLTEGRPRADLLVRAARLVASTGRERRRAKKLLAEAVEIVPTHPDARSDLAVMLELDGDVAELAALEERAASAFLDDPEAAADAGGADPKALAVQILDTTMGLYRFRLNAPVRALALCRRLLELEPRAVRRREDHARLLDAVLRDDPSAGRELVREAAEVWAELVERQPGFVEGLRRLRAHRLDLGEVRLARLAVEILEALGEATPSDAIPALPASAASGEGRDPRFELAAPPGEDEGRGWGPLLEVLGHAPLSALEDDLPEPRPKRRELVGPAGLGIQVSRPLGRAASVLGVELPPVYVREDAAAPVVPGWVGQPALLVSLERAGRCSEAELRYVAGRALSLLSPRALAVAILPLDVLREALVGLSRLPQPELSFADPKLAKKRGRALEKALAPAARAIAMERAATLLTEPRRPSLFEAREAALRAAEQAGLVAAGSLGAALGASSALAGGRVDRRWQLPLIRYAASRSFAELLRGMS